MADWSIINLTTAVVGFATTQPSTGKTINASVSNSGASSYSFSGGITGSNPSFTVLKGDKLVLSISASGHPFWIQTSSGSYNAANVVTENITNNGTQSGTLTWTPQTAGTYYYVCQYHNNMGGTITVSNLTIDIPNNIVTNNLDFGSAITETRPGWLTGRRPSQGQVFPRGVYNK